MSHACPEAHVMKRKIASSSAAQRAMSICYNNQSSARTCVVGEVCVVAVYRRVVIVAFAMSLASSNGTSFGVYGVNLDELDKEEEEREEQLIRGWSRSMRNQQQRNETDVEDDVFFVETPDAPMRGNGKELSDRSIEKLEKMRPPDQPSDTTFEQRKELYEHEYEIQQHVEKWQKNKYYQFAREVAGARGLKVETYFTLPAPFDSQRRYVPYSRRNRFYEQAKKEGDSNGNVPTVQKQEPQNGGSSSNAVEKTLADVKLELERKNITAQLYGLEAEKLSEERTWLERTDILGFGQFTEVLQQATQTVFAELSQYPNFRELPSANDIIETDDIAVRNSFANLVAMKISGLRLLNGYGANRTNAANRLTLAAYSKKRALFIAAYKWDQYLRKVTRTSN
jgi:hypothetical protein